jgi:hypothetical protein
MHNPVEHFIKNIVLETLLYDSSILLKRKAVSGVTLLVPILPLDKTPNYPPMSLLISKKTIYSMPSLPDPAAGQKHSPRHYLQ